MSYAKALGGVGIGVAIGYLFDPVSGRGRRVRLRDQANSRIRRSLRGVRQQAKYQVGQAQGLAHAVTKRSPVDVDEPTLIQKVRSEAVGPSAVRSHAIEVQLDDGVVVLRGSEHDRDAILDLVERVESVPGVRQVRNEISTV